MIQSSRGSQVALCARYVTLLVDRPSAAGAIAEPTDSKALLTVPFGAVASRDGRQVVFQIKDDRAVEVAVTTGKKVGSSIEITGGLKEGDKVIGKVDDQIKAGTKVALKAK